LSEQNETDPQFLANAVKWPLGDKTEQAQQEYLQTNIHVEALRVLAPNLGAYGKTCASLFLSWKLVIVANGSNLLSSQRGRCE